MPSEGSAEGDTDSPLSLEFLPMPRTVLIVDDERDTNDILASLVRARDFEPVQLFAGSPGRGRRSRPRARSLVLLDLMLPDIDGFAQSAIC